MMQLFSENSEWFLVVIFFLKKKRSITDIWLGSKWASDSIHPF